MPQIEFTRGRSSSLISQAMSSTLISRLGNCLGNDGSFQMSITPKILLIVGILVIILVVAVYGLTVLFTQSVPSANVKPPGGSPSAIGNCSTLSISPSSFTLSASSFTSGVINGTCNGSSAFKVLSAGLFTATIGGNCASPGYCYLPSFYSSLNLLNYTSWQSSGCGFSSPSGYNVPTTGGFITLTPGDYVYCWYYAIPPYNTNSPTSIPGFTITWNKP